MADATPTPRGPGRTAIVVMASGSGPSLCPFFSKCDGIILLDGGNGAREFHPNEHKTSNAICNLVLGLRPDRIICGFIGDAEKRKLRGAGIDVRLGSCACPIDELAACCCDLPEA